MPTKTKIDPNAVYQARESVSFSVMDTIRAGERRRGDDPLVREHPEFWVPDGTPIQRVPSAEPQAKPKRPRAEYDVTTYEAVQPLDVLVTRKPLRVRRAADDSIVQLPVGTAFDRHAEIIRLCREAFADPKSAVKR